MAGLICAGMPPGSAVTGTNVVVGRGAAPDDGEDTDGTAAICAAACGLLAPAAGEVDPAAAAVSTGEIVPLAAFALPGAGAMAASAPPAAGDGEGSSNAAPFSSPAGFPGGDCGILELS